LKRKILKMRRLPTTIIYSVPGCRVLDAGYSILDAGCWILDAGYSILDTRCWMLDARYRMPDEENRCKV
jgi:hypothetical protein